MDKQVEILIVDDSTASLRLLADILNVNNYTVRPTQHPKLALESAFGDPPDLILLDVKMPIMDGFEVCQRLKEDERTAKIPIIFVSVLESIEDRVRGFEAGGVDFITKPIQREEVLARVAIHLELFQIRRDLEERNRELALAYQSLQKSENKYRLLTENSPDMIFLMSLSDRSYTYVSPATTLIFGSTPEEWYDNPSFMEHVIHPDWKKAFLEGRADLSSGIMPPPTCEYQIIHKDGGVRWLTQRNIVEKDHHDQPTSLMGIVTDVTEQKIIENQLQQAQKMEAIGQLAGGIAHDFNNILSAILGFGEFIIQKSPAESEISADASQIIDATKRATGLVQQILTFSRQADIQKLALQPQPIAREAMKMLRATLPTSIAIEEHIDSDCGAILCNPTCLHQVIVNLCNNAKQAMANETGLLRIDLGRENVTLQDIPPDQGALPGEFIVLRVSDTGCGIAKEHLQRIFDPYFSTKDKHKCSGLGLAVVHGIVQDGKGFIKVSSELGKGTSMSVYFPATEIPVRQQQPAKKAAGREPEEATQGRIMVVDDEPMLAQINKRRLEERGYQVEVFTDSREALDTFSAHPDSFDLLVTDQTMPGLTGENLAQAILEIQAELPIIMCTGHTETFSEEEALEMGIVKYVYKPLREDELLDAVQEVLR
ncbi:MAG: response regulator [Thermodesulfobacteriota bacterium]